MLQPGDIQLATVRVLHPGKVTGKRFGGAAHLAIRQRKPLLQWRLLAVRGRWERVDGVEHLVAGRMEDLSGLLGSLPVDSRDFH